MAASTTADAELNVHRYFGGQSAGGFVGTQEAETNRLLGMMNRANLAKVKADNLPAFFWSLSSIGAPAMCSVPRFVSTMSPDILHGRGGSSRPRVVVIEGASVRSRLSSPRGAGARLMGLPDDYVLPPRASMRHTIWRVMAWRCRWCVFWRRTSLSLSFGERVWVNWQPITGDLTFTLQEFTKDRKFNGRGPLSVALVVIQHARNMGLPLDPEKLLTEGGGQVLGLGKSAVQAILYRHGIERVLAAEGGPPAAEASATSRICHAVEPNPWRRTCGLSRQSRRSGSRMSRSYFFTNPSRVRLDTSSSFASLLCRDILEQAEEKIRLRVASVVVSAQSWGT